MCFTWSQAIIINNLTKKLHDTAQNRTNSRITLNDEYFQTQIWNRTTHISRNQSVFEQMMTTKHQWLRCVSSTAPEIRGDKLHGHTSHVKLNARFQSHNRQIMCELRTMSRTPTGANINTTMHEQQQATVLKTSCKKKTCMIMYSTIQLRSSCSPQRHGTCG